MKLLNHLELNELTWRAVKIENREREHPKRGMEVIESSGTRNHLIYAKGELSDDYPLLKLENLIADLKSVDIGYIIASGIGSFFFEPHFFRAWEDESSDKARVFLAVRYVGTSGTHIRGFSISDLEKVSNDWGL